MYAKPVISIVPAPPAAISVSLFISANDISPVALISSAKICGRTYESVVCLKRRPFESIEQGMNFFCFIHMQLSFH